LSLPVKLPTAPLLGAGAPPLPGSSTARREQRRRGWHFPGRRAEWALLFGCLIFASSAAAAAPTPAFPVAEAPVAGFSPERLERLHEFMEREIAAGDYLGAVTLVARHGRIVAWRAFGHRDLARAAPLRPDAIFRIYSMTKTMTSVAVLMLMEEGRFTLDDPIGRWLPEFANARVFAGGTADAPELRRAARPITIRQLLTHTAGFATDGTDPAPVREIFHRVDLHASPDLRAYCAQLAGLPLAAEPGTRFSYDGVNTEVLARLIEVVSGLPFAEFMQRRLFAPLGLGDTGFSVSAAQRTRIAELSTTDADGRLVLATALSPTAEHPGEMLNPYPSGAGGLYSTAGDYFRFAQMLLNGGQIDGVSLLGRKTVDLMMSNHLAHLAPPALPSNPAEGFGLGGSVLLDTARRGRLGSAGQFGWSGAASTYYTIDRREQVIALLLLQHLPQGLPRDPPKLSTPFYNLVYQALLE